MCNHVALKILQASFVPIPILPKNFLVSSLLGKTLNMPNFVLGSLTHYECMNGRCLNCAWLKDIICLWFWRGLQSLASISSSQGRAPVLSFTLFLWSQHKFQQNLRIRWFVDNFWHDSQSLQWITFPLVYLCLPCLCCLSLIFHATVWYIGTIYVTARYRCLMGLLPQYATAF